MPIKTIEVICLPCSKCEGLEGKIRGIVNSIEMLNRVKIPFEFKHTKTLQDIDRHGLNAAQTPVILINGKVENAGRVDPVLLRKRFEVIQKFC